MSEYNQPTQPQGQQPQYQGQQPQYQAQQPQYQGQPPQYQAQQPQYYQQQPKKQSGGKGCLIGCLVTFLIFIVIIVAAVFGIKAYMRSLKPEELDYNKKDVASFFEKTGLNNDKDTPSLQEILIGEMVSEGTREIDVLVTSEEVTGVIQEGAGKNDFLEDITVNFVDDDEIEVQGIIGDKVQDLYKEVPELEQFKFILDNLEGVPLSYQGGIEYDQEKGIQLDPDRIKVGFFKVPKKMAKEHIELVENLLNARIEAIEGLDIESIDFTEEGMKFVGTIPEALKKN